jgi:hypothetical protein
MSPLFGIFLILFLLLAYAVIRVVNSITNDLEWSQLISSKGHDGQQYADWNKIGQGCGVILCVWLPAVYAHSDKADAVGLSAIMGVALLYLGGVSSYAATLRARRGTTETTRISESPARTMETTTETPRTP